MKATSNGRGSEEQTQLCERQRLEVLKLEQSHRDQRLALESRQKTELVELEALHMQQIYEVWQGQGRQLGPGALRALAAKTPARGRR